MLIIRLLFYLVDGTMDSSFLTGLNVSLGLYSIIQFFKMIIQFGLPNHPARFVTYLVLLCTAFYFTGLAAVDWHLFSPWDWIKWRTLPMVAGGLALLLQIIMLIGDFSHIQQKVIARLPIMVALLFFAFFPSHADVFLAGIILAALLFLAFSRGQARYQKRLFFKMSFFLGLQLLLKASQVYLLYIVGQALLGVALFYLFVFEHSCAVAVLIDQQQEPTKGEVE
jgi:hypothetical protein